MLTFPPFVHILQDPWFHWLKWKGAFDLRWNEYYGVREIVYRPSVLTKYEKDFVKDRQVLCIVCNLRIHRFLAPRDIPAGNKGNRQEQPDGKKDDTPVFHGSCSPTANKEKGSCRNSKLVSEYMLQVMRNINPQKMALINREHELHPTNDERGVSSLARRKKDQGQALTQYEQYCCDKTLAYDEFLGTIGGSGQFLRERAFKRT